MSEESLQTGKLVPVTVKKAAAEVDFLYLC